MTSASVADIQNAFKSVAYSVDTSSMNKFMLEKCLQLCNKYTMSVNDFAKKVVAHFTNQNETNASLTLDVISAMDQVLEKDVSLTRESNTKRSLPLPMYSYAPMYPPSRYPSPYVQSSLPSTATVLKENRRKRKRFSGSIIDKENALHLNSNASHNAASSEAPGSASTSLFLELPDAVLTLIFTYFVAPAEIDIETFLCLQQACTRLMALCNSPSLWHEVPLVLREPRRQPLTVVTHGNHSSSQTTVAAYTSDRMTFNKNAFKLIKVKVERGTEGRCFKAFCRPHQKCYAVKRANTPKNLQEEGVPYYFIRELAALKHLKHDNVNELLMVCLNSAELYSVYPYIELSLYEYMYPPTSNSDLVDAPNPLPRRHALALMKQLFCALAFFHGRGILHRNLKPKHLLLIPGPSAEDPLEGCTLKVADFSLVRMVTCNARELTSEVVTLWYRCPEILLGKKAYSSAVDVWSAGCIFAEMLQGIPLFSGQCEVEQLFSIFKKLGSPIPAAWPEVSSLPHYAAGTFPDWQGSASRLSYFIGNAEDADLEVVGKCLLLNPAERITAHEASAHPVFGDSSSHNQSVSSSSSSGVSSSSSSESATLGDPPYALYNNARTLDSGAALSETYLRKLHFLHQLELQSTSSGAGPLLLQGVERSQVADLLVSTVMKFQDFMCQRTLFFAMGLVDRFLQRTCAKGSQGCELFTARSNSRQGALAALSTTCLHVASKCEDTSYISLRDLYDEGGAPAPSEALLLEERLLTSLDFDLYVPTTIDFLRALCMIFTNAPGSFNWNVGNRPQDTASFDGYHSFCALLSFLAEATFHFDYFSTQRQSVVAAGVMRHAMTCFDFQWPASLDQVLRVVLGGASLGDKDIAACTAEVARMHGRLFFEAGLRPLAIRTKYSSAQHDKWTPR